MKKKKNNTKSENSIDLISGHLKKFFNDDEIIVFHELVSESFHLDIYVVMANHQRPYHLLMTCGMSSQPMNVPNGYDHRKYCELVTLIPSSFSLDLTTMTNEEYTPIKILQDLSKYPFVNNTWFDDDHTIEIVNEDDNKQSGCILLPVLLLPKEFSVLRGRTKTINFYQVYHLSSNEFNDINRMSVEDRPDYLERSNVPHIYNPNR